MEWILLSAVPLLILTLVAAVAGAFLWSVGLALSRTDQQSRLRREREGDDYGMFRARFAGQEVPEIVIAAVYDHLSNRVFVGPGFPVRPTDSLREVFDIGPEGSNDLDLLIRSLAERTQAQYVSRLSTEAPPSTVADLVIHIARMPRTAVAADSQTLLRSTTTVDENLLRSTIGASLERDDQLLRPTEET